MTDITTREIENLYYKTHCSVTNEAKETVKNLADLKKLATELQGNYKDIKELSLIFDKLQGITEIAEKAFRDQLDRYICEGEISILKTHNVSVSKIFDKYFNRIPPFHKESKKAEFPDAFAIEAIIEWSKEHNQEKIFVVSGDKDWEESFRDQPLVNYFKNFHSLFTSIFPDYVDANEVLSNWLSSTDGTSKIQSKISDELKPSNFLPDTYNALEEATVLKITVNWISIVESMFTGTEKINDEITKLSFTFRVDIEYKAEISLNSSIQNLAHEQVNLVQLDIDLCGTSIVVWNTHKRTILSIDSFSLGIEDKIRIPAEINYHTSPNLPFVRAFSNRVAGIQARLKNHASDLESLLNIAHANEPKETELIQSHEQLKLSLIDRIRQCNQILEQVETIKLEFASLDPKTKYRMGLVHQKLTALTNIAESILARHSEITSNAYMEFKRLGIIQ
jgi:hypothetical protein